MSPVANWGVYDVHGNAWEWVEDCAQDTYQGAPTDGSAWTLGECSRRVLRGGAWGALYLRSAYRGSTLSGLRGSFLGFRLARTLNP